MPALVSAYVPCCNNALTVRRTVQALLEQTVPPAEILVVDDGSTDASVAQLGDLPVRILRQTRNLGRGATRARAMREAAHEFVLSCDATIALENGFVAKALPWFEAAEVGAVFGRIVQPAAMTVAARWRGRHLFKMEQGATTVRRGASLMTGGTMVRRSAVEAAGGFDAALRHSEDADLGRRLLASGFDVFYDPAMTMTAFAGNSVAEVLERYWRWYAGADERVSWRGYRKNIGYAVKAMAVADLRAGDPLAALVSLACPHYQFWKSWSRRRAVRSLEA